jgi:hypothetical protein
MGALLRLRKSPATGLLAAALLLNLLDVAAQMLHWHGNLPYGRFGLGLLLGAGAGAVLFSLQGALPLPQGLLNRLRKRS